MKDIEILAPLFWEYSWESLKNKLKSPFVIARVLELGDPSQFRVLERAVGKEVIKEFLKEKGEKTPYYPLL